jgi:trk system potassium uptake protein TrkA
MKSQRFVVIGLGNFGSSVAEALTAEGHEVIAIDQRGEAVDRLAPHVARGIVGDGCNLQTLERAGARGAYGAVVSTGDDITASILATMILHDLKIRDVYVKVVSREHARVMERIGVTESIFPEREAAVGLGARLSGVGLLNYVRLGAGFSVQEMAVPQAWNGKPLRELQLRQRYNVTIVALHDMLTGEITATPDPDAALKESDSLFIAGKDSDLSQVAQLS